MGNKWRVPVVLVYKKASMGLGRPEAALIPTDEERIQVEFRQFVDAIEAAVPRHLTFT
jgi:hypothetical protein